MGGVVVPITSFQYQDVGIRLDIEPRLHHNKEVTLKIKVEVSNLAGTVAGVTIGGATEIYTAGAPVRKLAQASNTGAATVAAACPFCATMLSDGLMDKESSVVVKDIAELLAEAIGE